MDVIGPGIYRVKDISPRNARFPDLILYGLSLYLVKNHCGLADFITHRLLKPFVRRNTFGPVYIFTAPS